MGLVCGFVKTENKSRQVSYAIVGVLLGADYRVVSFNASSTRVDFMGEFKKSKHSIMKAKGPMTHGTFNARNYDAGISTPGLRGVAFDAGAFDAWKIDAG